MTKISALAAVTSVAVGDELVLARAGTTKKIDADFMPGFQLSYVEFTSNVGATATTEAGANTVVTAGAITFDGTTQVLIEFFYPTFGSTVTAVDLNLWLYDGASSIGCIDRRRAFANATVAQYSCYVARVITPSAAAHTYSIRASLASAGTYTIVVGAGGVGVMVPGFIRVTKT